MNLILIIFYTAFFPNLAHAEQYCKLFTYQEKERNWCISGNFDSYQNFSLSQIMVKDGDSLVKDMISFDTRKNEITQFCSNFNFYRGLLKSKPVAENNFYYSAVGKNGNKYSDGNTEITCLASDAHPGPDRNIWTTLKQKKDIKLGNAVCIIAEKISDFPMMKKNEEKIFLKYQDGHTEILYSDSGTTITYSHTVFVIHGDNENHTVELFDNTDVLSKNINKIVLEIENEGVSCDDQRAYGNSY